MEVTLGSYGSGLDVETIVKALVDADIAPKTNSLDRKEEALTSELSAFGSLKSAMTSIDDSLESLSDGSAFDLMSIDAPSEATVVQTGSPAAGQLSLEIDQLATSQVLATVGFASATTAVGTGTLSISVGSPSYVGDATSGEYTGFTALSGKTADITISSSNNTLSGIRDAVNAAAIGVTASLVSDGGLTRLLFTADDTGASTAISITSSDSGLASLTHGYTDGGGFSSSLTEARSSVDARYKLNGLSLTSSTNKITGLIEGLDVTLTEVTSGAKSIVIAPDAAAIESRVQAFIDAYNNFQTTLSSLTDYRETTGVLAGDSTARRIQSAIRSITTGSVTISGNSFSSLLEAGVSSDRYGKLTLDSVDFQSALSSNKSDLKALFAGSTTFSNLSDNTDETGVADLLRDSLDDYLNSATGLLISKENSLESDIDGIADDRAKVIARMSSLEEKYTRQFTAMDTLVGQLKGTSQYLTNQMDAIKAAANR